MTAQTPTQAKAAGRWSLDHMSDPHRADAAGGASLSNFHMIAFVQGGGLGG